MKFFIYLHRSVSDPSFYGEVLGFRAGRAVWFIVRLALIVALLDGFLQARRAADADNGVPSVMPRVFPGMAIRDASLDPGRPTPWAPAPQYVARLMSLLAAEPDAAIGVPDSFIVIDTSRGAYSVDNPSKRFVFTSDALVVNLSPLRPYVVPYSVFFPRGESLEFTRSAVTGFLKRRFVEVVVFFSLQHGLALGLNVAFAVLFLAFAAYIFRSDRAQRYRTWLKAACFAVSPMPVGRALVALSGTRAEWVWQVSIVVSTFVMFRAVRFISQDGQREGDGGTEQ
ncbi:MAG: hypothetical protein GF418_03035 [Chitinivibrionales bacterium]|nr:hypothetical protein [Chitinivibrionales bacterium]MBD3394577.1 hypothetical protein [Chitinivibrionales bacterium]